jgi:NADPH:quinone reductase
MKSVAYQAAGALDRPEALVDIEQEKPLAKGRDLLVAVRAISVNPVDTKIRRGVSAAPDGWKVLGWDAVGEVIETGEAVTRFKPGDQVFYPAHWIDRAPTASFIWWMSGWWARSPRRSRTRNRPPCR